MKGLKNNNNISQFSAPNAEGFVFRFFNLISVLNVEENLALPLNLDGKEADEKTYTVVGTVTVFFSYKN